MDDCSQYLLSTPYFDFTEKSVREFVSELQDSSMSQSEKAIDLYYRVRDGIRYNPYTVSDGTKAFKASFCIERGESFCIPKAVVLGAAARALGIPARLGLADVKNHMASQKLLDWLKTDLFTMHGFIELYLNGQWVKATPAFNKELCDKMGLKALDFDGENDAIFQEFSSDGTAFMEYLKNWGTFDEVPVDFILQRLAEVYPHIYASLTEMQGHSLEADLEDET